MEHLNSKEQADPGDKVAHDIQDREPDPREHISA